MSSLTAWIINLTLGLCAVIITAGAHQPFLNLIATGLVSAAFASKAIRENRTLIADGGDKSAFAASTARHIGLVWAWGALALLVIYWLVFENSWPEWWQFFLSFATAAVGCIIFANMLGRDEDAARGPFDHGSRPSARQTAIHRHVGRRHQPRHRRKIPAGDDSTRIGRPATSSFSGALPLLRSVPMHSPRREIDA